MINRRILVYSLVLCAFSAAAALDDGACRLYEGQTITWIKFEGLKGTKPFVVERELIHNKGGEFKCEQWSREQKRLESLDIFAIVDLKINAQEGSTGLVYTFEELPVFFPLIGGKKTDQVGLVAGPAVASLNLFGRDLRLEAHARTSVEDFFAANELLIVANSYWLGNLPIEYWAGYAYTDNENPFLDFMEESQIFSLEVQQRIRNPWSIKYKAEFFTITTDKASRQEALITGKRDNIPRAGLGFVRDSREARYNPHRGHYNEFLITYSGLDANFTEFLSDWRGYIPIGKKQIIHLGVLGQYRYGSVGAYDNYFIGGVNTLRGYDPVEDGISGTSEILTMLEYRYEFFSKKNFRVFGLSWFYGLQAVAGIDMAYAWMDNHIDAGSEGRSVYMGLHILTPGIDRFRLELGNKAMGFEVDMGFGFGLFERTTVQRWRIR